MIIILQDISVCFICGFLFLMIHVRSCGQPVCLPACLLVRLPVYVCILSDVQMSLSPFLKGATQLVF